MEFGNWRVDDEGIHWTGGGLHHFDISNTLLTKLREEKEGRAFYDWILLATDEDWLSQDDLYDLNYAFVYAAAKFRLDFDYRIFDDTLAEQYEQFEAEDREDCW